MHTEKIEEFEPISAILLLMYDAQYSHIDCYLSELYITKVYMLM